MDEAIDCVEAATPTVFWGVPTFVRSFFRRARERNVRFRRARMVILTGEPVSPALQEELAEHLRAFGAEDPQVRVRYSFTEMQGGLVQCCNDAAAQNVAPDLYYLETVDPETGIRVPEGEEGAIALTHLHRRGTVCLRYLVGDLVGLRTEHCPHCDRFGERIVRRPRRTGTLVKVRGMLINPELIFEALSSDHSISEFQLVVRKSDPADPDSMDRLVLRLEAETGSQARLAGEIPGLIQKIVARARGRVLRVREIHNSEKRQDEEAWMSAGISPLFPSLMREGEELPYACLNEARHVSGQDKAATTTGSWTASLTGWHIRGPDGF
jgi:phenylacetate-coenzyme A ligase PaaK-like adenylate-forming protein